MKNNAIQYALMVLIFVVFIFLIVQLFNYQPRTVNNLVAGENSSDFEEATNFSLYLLNIHHVEDYNIIAAFDENGVIHELTALNFQGQTIINHVNFLGTQIQDLLFEIEKNYLPQSENKIYKLILTFSIYENGEEDKLQQITNYFKSSIDELTNYSYDIIILDKIDFFSMVNTNEEILIKIDENDMEQYLKENLNNIIDNKNNNQKPSVQEPTKPSSPKIELPSSQKNIELDHIPEIPEEIEVNKIPSLQ